MRRLLIIGIISLGSLSATVHAADLGSEAFDAALCKPVYSVKSATALYEKANKAIKPDMSSGAATYKLPRTVERDGFTATHVFVAGTSIGVLIDGERAGDLAAKYQLVKEDPALLKRYTAINPYAGYNSYTKGYARQMTVNGKAVTSFESTPVTMLIAARESQTLPGKTILMCEVISEFDLKQAKAGH